MTLDGRTLLSLFPSDEPIDGVFYKFLTGNDDSGRHGVLVPVEAYSFFPEIASEAPAENAAVAITTVWSESGTWVPRPSTWRLYQRYPERRLTSLSPTHVNTGHVFRLMVVGRTTGTVTPTYFCVVLVPGDPRYQNVVSALELAPTMIGPGLASGVRLRERLLAHVPNSARDVLVARLAAITQLGYLPSLRRGDTGVGFTLESALGIAANSSRSPDFMGIEIKSSRSNKTAALRGVSSKRVTLFAKTPSWGPNESRRGLLDRHGYFDSDGRWSLYMSIYAGRPNPQGWRLVPQEERGRLASQRFERDEVWWPYSDLEAALTAKHKQSAFVTAHAVVRDGREHFWYDHVTMCQSPNIKNLLSIIAERDLSVDFAIHRLPDGGARDHGFLFRTTEAQLPRLFDEVERLRLA